MILGDARNESKQPFIPENRDLLDLFEKNVDNRLVFDGHELGYSFSVNTVDRVEKIQINGAVVEPDSVNPKQANITISSGSGSSGSGYTPVEIDTTWDADVNQLVICKAGGISVNLPDAPADKSMIKIATLDSVNPASLVTITSSSTDFISAFNNQEMIINTSYSSIELVYNASLKIWRVVTPFAPQAISASGLTAEEAKAVAKKQAIIFG